MLLLGLSLLAFSVSYLGLISFRKWAERKLLDIPNQRSSHIRPIPRSGGIAIVVITLVGACVFITASRTPMSFHGLWGFVIGSALIAGISFADDLKSLSERTRLAVQGLAALVTILDAGYCSLITLPFIGETGLGWFGLPFTFIWFIGLTNSYNFMDGIDGIAGGQAVIAGFSWTLLGWLGNQQVINILGILLASSSLGFLLHNWSPARIFMGDVGSAFLGYTFAFLGVIAAQSDPRLALVGVLFVWPFVFDTVFTFLRRWRKGENVFAAHRSHLYQRLVIAKYSHQFVTILYSGLAAVGAALAFAWWADLPGSGYLITIFVPLLCFGLWRFVVRIENRAR